MVTIRNYQKWFLLLVFQVFKRRQQCSEILVVSGGRFLGGYMLAFSFSRESASVMINAIRGATEFKVIAHLDQLAKVRHDVSGRREARAQCLLTWVLECMPSPVCHTIRRAIDFQTSGWLTVLPLTCHHFDLSPQQFRDALSLCIIGHYH